MDISARTQGDRVEALLALAYELEQDRSDQRIFTDASAFFTAQEQELSGSTWWKVRSPKYLITSYAFLATLAGFLDVKPQVLTREQADLPEDMGEGLAMLHEAKLLKVREFMEQQFGDVDGPTRQGILDALR
ncbi:hypothetical protein ACTXJX_11925 [Glutamicibacter ardleyensis]